MIAAASVAVVHCRRALHMLQLDSYLNARYLRWLLSKPLERVLDWRAVAAGVAVLVAMVPLFPDEPYPLLLWTIYPAAVFLRKPEGPAKKPLDMTARAKRMLWTARALIAFTAIGAAVAIVASMNSADTGRRLFIYPATLVAMLLAHSAPWMMMAANVLLRPVQSAINRRFVRRAARKIAKLKPDVVGVAGSYGKTSTKYLIEAILSERYSTLKTPGSFNTLLGVTRVINETLDPRHKVFVVEMGAYKRGEVREICDLVSPKIGIITSIGPEHYERFLSMENIEETNY